MKYTEHYHLKQPEASDAVRVEDFNENVAALDEALYAHALELNPSLEKLTPADTDSLVLADSTAKGKKKRLTWGNLVAAMKSGLGTFFAALDHGHGIEDVTDLATALSKKANAIETVMDGDISGITPLTSSEYVIGPAVTGLPLNDRWWIGSVSSHFGSILRIDITCVHSPSINYRTTYENGNWHGWIPLATATPPQELALPLAEGWTHINDYDALKYGMCGDGRLQIMGLIISPPNAAEGQPIATLPTGYRPTGRQVWIHALEVYTKLEYAIRVPSDGVMAFWGNAPSANAVLLIPVQTFPAPSGTNASSQVRMSVPATKAARSAIPKEPETRLMCVVDAAGNYVEFVQVTITYDEGWETEGALFSVYCYTMQDGETLVDSPQPPPMRRHAGGAGLVQPVWDFKGKAWVETATAEEISAWELEHPAPPPAPPSPLDKLQEENKLLTAKVTALAEQNEFQEELIVELAGTVYA